MARRRSARSRQSRSASWPRALREPLIVDAGPLPGIDDKIRLLARPIESGAPGGPAVVVVGASRDDRDEALAALRSVLLVGVRSRCCSRRWRATA